MNFNAFKIILKIPPAKQDFFRWAPTTTRVKMEYYIIKGIGLKDITQKNP